MEATQTNALVLQIQQNNLSPDMSELLQKSFLPFYEQAEKWMDTAKTIEVTDISQTKEMKLARDARLALKDVRVAVEKKRKELKDESLRTGKAIDGVANVLKGLIEPIELHLQQQEDFAKAMEEKRITALDAERAAQIAPYVGDLNILANANYGAMPQHQFDALLFGYKTQRENQIAESKRVEEERIAKEKQDAADREAQRAENERLKKEAEEQEKKANELAEKFAAEMKVARQEQERVESEARKQREESEREANRIKAEAAAKLKKEQDEREKIERENQRLIDAENKRIADQKEAEEKERKDKLAAEKKAARAPDKQKLFDLAIQISATRFPDVKSSEAELIITATKQMLKTTVDFINEKANSL